MAEGLRIDKWLWSVRVFKTRTAATKACDSGTVLIGGESVKPARRVRVDDRVTIKRKTSTTELVVVALLDKRVSATLAAEAYEDVSPEPTAEELELQAIQRSIHGRFSTTPVRERGTGRPTKRDRRRLDEFEQRSRE